MLLVLLCNTYIKTIYLKISNSKFFPACFKLEFLINFLINLNFFVCFYDLHLYQTLDYLTKDNSNSDNQVLK